MAYETIVIPKGTVLFRGFDNTSTLTSDFGGIPNGEDFCLGPNFNVFFYPFPFISSTIKMFKYATIYVTSRDLKLVNLILPSKYNRQHKEMGRGGIVSCDQIDIGCNAVGRNFDPCVDYTKVPQDVTGMIAIADFDAQRLKYSKILFRNWANKYFATYKDSRRIVGVPEFILHPRMDKTPRTEKITDFEPWYRTNKNAFNYIYLHVMEYDPIKVQALMDEFMSEDGLDLGDDEPYHMKMNKKTGFFQIAEFSNNQSELISPDLSVNPTVLTRKSIYKTISDKYPKADTIPAMLNSYYIMKYSEIEAGNIELDGGLAIWLSKFFDSPVSREFVNTDGRPSKHTVYHIDGKRYVFLPNPEGRAIEKRATYPPRTEYVSRQPINEHISAYEISIDGKNGKNVASREPARHINGLAQHFAQKNGLLGASRRRTRRRPLLRSR
jgi:hypothetical protein